MAAPDKPLQLLGQHQAGNDESAFGTLATMIAYDARLSTGLASPVNITYEFVPTMYGRFIAVGADGKIRQVGSPINPKLSVIGWEAQYLVYQAALETRLSAPALTISVFTSATGSASATVQLPPQALRNMYVNMDPHVLPIPSYPRSLK